MNTEKFTHSDLLEVVAEAIRQARRSYVKPLDLSSVVVVDFESTAGYLQLSVMENNASRNFRIDITETETE